MPPASQSGCAQQSASMNASSSPRAARMPSLRVAAGPCRAVCESAVTPANRRMTSRLRSVERLSTRMISNRSRGKLWARSEAISRGSAFSALWTGTMTLTKGSAPRFILMIRRTAGPGACRRNHSVRAGRTGWAKVLYRLAAWISRNVERQWSSRERSRGKRKSPPRFAIGSGAGFSDETGDYLLSRVKPLPSAQRA